MPCSPEPGATSLPVSKLMTFVLGIAPNLAVVLTLSLVAMVCPMPPSLDPRMSITTVVGMYSKISALLSAENIAPVDMIILTDDVSNGLPVSACVFSACTIGRANASPTMIKDATACFSTA